ncbi:MAG: ferredoxin [Patescibacteria group bacterium]|jgi:ferredoxin
MSNNNKPISRTDGVTVEIDREACIGAASCVTIAGAVFELDDEQKAIIIDANGEDLDTIIQAAQSCPTDAIIVKDKDGNQLWP